jgi:hypothetical protein
VGNVVTDAVIACAQFASRGTPTPTEAAALVALRNGLAIIFGTIAKGIAGSARFRAWRPVDASPGYLVRDVSGLEVYAPWNLIADFPEGDSLSEFVELARRVRCDSSAICLSGSAAVQSAVRVVGDIDYCEYIDLSGPEMSEALSRATLVDAGDLLCLETKVIGTDATKRLVRPWSATERAQFLEGLDPATVGKCDFVALTAAHGAVELTKVVLRVDSANRNSEPWNKSFAFQEAMIAQGVGWAPRTRTAPEEVGIYVRWLMSQVNHYSSREAVKAGKRALALSRLAFLSDVANDVIAFLSREGVTQRALFRSRSALGTRLQGLTHEVAKKGGRSVEDLLVALARDRSGRTGTLR